MNNEIKIEDYLHLYLGCNVRFRGQELKGRINQENLWKMFSVTKMEYGLQGNLFALGCVMTIKAEDIYPLLRPLSDMTEEESIALAKIHKYDIPEDEGVREELINVYKTGDENTLILGKYLPVKYYLEGLLWLCKNWFDLFGLIEAGIAIDKTINKEPNVQEGDASKDDSSNKAGSKKTDAAGTQIKQ